MSFYRAFRFPWSARPTSPPAVLASLNDTGEETIVHASWNGATGSPPGACWPVKKRGSLKAQARSHRADSRARRRCPTSTPTWRCRRSTRPATCWALDGRRDRLLRLAGAAASGEPADAVVGPAALVGRFGLVLWLSSCSSASCSTSVSRSSSRRGAAAAAAPGHRDRARHDGQDVSMAVSGVLLMAGLRCRSWVRAPTLPGVRPPIAVGARA